MRFVHIGDIHLGKLLYQQNLLEIQKDLLEQLCDYLVKEDIDVLIMAGDIYDRSVPSNEAVDVLNAFLTKVIKQCHKKVLMIAGNHDSASRLSFASGILASEGLYIVAYPLKKMEPIVIDGINFYLVPFFKPSYIRYLYDNNDLMTYQDAFDYYLKQQDIDYSLPNVLVTHQFIAGNKEVVRSESEAVLSVGGSEIIDVDIVKDFDYVALGHIHAPQRIGKDTIRYSGSLMRYSFDEVKQDKSICDVTIKGKDVSFKQVKLNPSQDLIKISSTFKEIMEELESNNNDFVAIELLDKDIIPNAIDYLRTKYKYVLQITYKNLISELNDNTTKADGGFEKMNPVDLFEQFYQKIKGQQLDEESKDIIASIIMKGEQNVT